MSDSDSFLDGLDESIDQKSELTAKIIEALQTRSAQNRKDALEAEKDKRREDWAGTNKWVIGLVLGMAAIFAVAMGNLMTQINAFNRELREVRDRITVIETERKFEKTENRNSN